MASQIAVQVAIWPLVIALIVHVVRSAHRWPAVLPVAATILLLVGTAVGTVAPDLTLLVGSVWWIALPVILGTYPDGRFVPRWVAVPVAVYLAFAAAYVISAGEIAEQWGGVAGVSTLLLLGAPAYRYLRRSTSEERESVRWAILAVLVGFAAFMIITVIESGTVAEHGPLSVAAANLAGAIMPIGFAVGLLRPRLIDVDRALTVVIVGVISVTAIALFAVSASFLADLIWPPAAPAAAVIVVAVVTTPTILLARRAAEWVVFRGRVDENTAIAALDQQLASIGDASTTPAAMLSSTVESLRLSGAELRGDPHLTSRIGDLSPGSEEFPVSYQGELIATLRAAPRHGESTLAPYDRRVLRRLASHAAPALHAARAVAELREAHAATLRAREEERRRLRRDLHDDLSPTLAGLGLSAAAIAHLARHGDDVSAEADALADDVQSAMAQTRELAYGLRPPILDDLGLVAAIRSRVHGASADSLDVHVDAEALPDELPAAVDIAVLRIVQEAVENTRRHARARRCEVRIAVADDVLLVTVDDDGVGFQGERRTGLGMGSIRDRAGELGGATEFTDSRLGGAAVRVSLPLLGASG